MTVTGWLGWTPEVALTTPLQQINLAMEGKIDFLKKTNPWGSKEDEEQEQDLMKRAPDPEGAARSLVALVQRKGAIVLNKKGP